MANMIYKYLHLANYKDIPNWSVQYADEEDLEFTKKYLRAKIGEFLVKSKDIIEVEDDVEYKQVTIKINNGGVVPRNNGETILGSKIGTKRQHVVHAGQFIMSKIDARNGAYGIIPKELDGAIVTNDFPVFDVDISKIIPQFLVLVSTTEKFVEFARKCSSGTTNRKRIDIDAFLNQQIPLPSIEEQERILREYNTTINDSKRIEKIIEKYKKNIFTFLQKELNVEAIEESHNEQNKLLSFATLSSMARWDCYNTSYFLSNRKMEKTIGQLVKNKPFYGAPYSAIKYDGEIRYIRITDINEDGNLAEEMVSANAYNETYLLKENDFLIARSGNTVGKTFLYSSEYGPAIFAGYLIKFELNDKIIIPQYLLIYTKSPLFKKWINSNMRVSAQPNINSKQYLDAPIIVPDMEVQEKIVKYAQEMRSKINTLRKDMEQLKANATIKFNEYLFGES